ncbi:membrane-associating domain protein [Metarhizium robertsii]|uniref:Might be a transmembrane protein n=2 Tax=Metarhizium robertsii TaxID=568076 RepID=E9EK93_METRA|nr:might be a transmembrane protein [Metarhizium robertsii ARSEF 23]EFZ03834.1 might be a transmembrane protein [Metarhizium robertsii ARSEF 23]EXV01856.1 membrane-associating domain protein [Metarhizium robertsii]
MAHGTLRAAAAFCHFMVFASAVIVTGLVSWFLNGFRFRGSHIVYTEVIAVITIPIYLVAMIAPVFKSYEGYFLPVNFIFSYLWLTSFIFSAVDWSGHLCRQEPLGANRCGRKRAVEAFNFIAFFFLLCNIIIEAFLLRAFHNDRRESNVVTKERPVSQATRNSAASATPAAAGQNGTAPATQV